MKTKGKKQKNLSTEYPIHDKLAKC